MEGKRVMMINDKDNVGVAMDELQKEDLLEVKINGTPCSLKASEFVPRFHKIAVKKIPEGEIVFKYGETIGVAIRDILPGEHVHTHNIKGLRG